MLGFTAFVNLTSEEVKVIDTPEELVKNFLGGRGMNIYYLWRYLKPQTDPFSPDNPLIFGPGLLTGTRAPSSSRMNISAKSPESLILGDANMGGNFGAMMRRSGFMNLIITGKAEIPKYILLENGAVKILDASDLWGREHNELYDIMRKRHGAISETATIGRAGEKLVRMAAIVSTKKAVAARGGMGAVMGSKNLKAVVAAGGWKFDYFDSEQLMIHSKEKIKELTASKVIQVLGKYGTSILYRTSNALGAIRTNNSQLNASLDTMDHEHFHKLSEKMFSCYGCVVHCRHKNTQGGEGPEYSTIGILGTNCGITDPLELIKLNNLANDLALDTSSLGSILAWAFELYERGIITNELTGGIKLEFGNYDLMVKLMNMISLREGFGDILAESTQAAKKFGENSKDFLIAVKDLPQSDPHDCRIIKSFALGLAVASRGADHLRNRPTLDIFKLPEEVKEKIYGAKVSSDITAYDTKEIMVYFHENIYAVGDALGICRFVTHTFNSPHLTKYEEMQKFIYDAIGLEYTVPELKEIGCRIVDLERMINIREGVTRASDTLPKRYFDDPIPLKQYKGEKIDREEFAKMLTRYYELRHWGYDGIPPKSRYDEIESLATLPLSASVI